MPPDASGDCGACTVLVSRRDPSQPDVVQHRSINACLAPVYSVAGCHVITVEGIGSTKRGLHPVQARLAKSHGSQCGFCTPGFVMSMYALLRSKNGEPISEEEIEEKHQDMVIKVKSNTGDMVFELKFETKLKNFQSCEDEVLIQINLFTLIISQLTLLLLKQTLLQVKQ